MNEKVVFLKFGNERTEPDGLTYLSCAVCRNKTFVVLQDNADGFPLMQCACCRLSIGRFGWADE